MIIRDNYSTKTPVLAIDLTYGLGVERDLVDYYYYQNNKGEKYIDDLGTMVINMDKVMESWYNKNTKEVQENKHLICVYCGPEDLKILSKGDKLVEEYTDAITKLNTNDQFRQIMTLEEENAKMDRSNLKRAEEKGFEEGVNIGHEKGQSDFIKQMLSNGATIEDISKMSGLPTEEIESLIKV